jgi:hypothetical protein
MEGGRFLKSPNGRLWLTVFKVRLTRQVEDLPRGWYWFAIRMRQLESGDDVMLTALFTERQVAEMSPVGRNLHLAAELDGEHLYIDGEQVWSAWSNHRFRFFTVAEKPDGSKTLAWRWRAALEKLRGRPIQNIVETRMAAAGEI